MHTLISPKSVSGIQVIFTTAAKIYKNMNIGLLALIYERFAVVTLTKQKCWHFYAMICKYVKQTAIKMEKKEKLKANNIKKMLV